jgi:hypothetical protein
MFDILAQFFAVTITSIYKVVAIDEHHQPYAEKIALRGKSSMPVGSKIDNGSMIAICHRLQIFIPEGHGLMSPLTSYERHIESVNTRYWGGGTTPIVALFLTEEEARQCFAEPNPEPCDKRWLDSTKKVLQMVGEDHPTITVCHYPDMALIQA